MRAIDALIALSVVVAGAAQTVMQGTAPLLVPSSLVGGSPVTDAVLSLTHTTALVANDVITCTFDAAIFATDAAVAVAVSGAAQTASAASVAMVLTITVTASIAAEATTYTLTSNLAAQQVADTVVGVACVSTADDVPLSLTAYTVAPSTSLGWTSATPNTLLSGATPASVVFILTTTTVVPASGTIVITASAAIWAQPLLTICSASPYVQVTGLAVQRYVVVGADTLVLTVGSSTTAGACRLFVFR